MHLQLITLSGVSVDTDVYEVVAPTPMGPIAIFPDHEALVSMASQGVLVIRYQKNDPNTKIDLFAISGGIIEIGDNAVRVLVDEADYGDDIIEAESQASLERALKLRDEAKTRIEIDKASQLIDRHKVRLHVAELHRRYRRK